MKRLILSAAAALLLVAATAAPASAFGLHGLDATFTNANGTPATEAGTHPFAFTTTLEADTVNEEGKVPEGSIKTLIIDQPAGLVVDPSAVPTCSAAQFAIVLEGLTNCPDASAIGVIEVLAEEGADFGPVYNLEAPPGSAVKLGFHVLGVGVVLEGGLRPEGEQNAFATVTNISQVEPFFGSKVTLWGNPFDPAHNGERGKCLINKGSCPAGNAEAALLTLPTRCTGPLTTTFRANSWQDPGTFFADTATTPETTECGKIGFDPQVSSTPTATSAESPSGLDFNLSFDDPGLSDPKGTAQSHVKKAVVTLPEGMSVNPSQAEGLGVCSEAGFKAETATSPPGAGCPQSSKIGTIDVATPLLDEPLEGSVFVAAPYANPFNSLIALYMVIRNPQRGILVRMPAKVDLDPATGQLTTTVDNLPQQPFSNFSFHFRAGARSPLVTPPACGDYQIQSTFTPYSGGPPVTKSSPFKVTSGVGAGPCPAGAPPFGPSFEAGTFKNSASDYSPFYMRFTRKDGEQALTRFDAILPPGLAGKIAGIPRCSDAALAAAKSKSGLQEIAAPSCPADSRVGRVLVGAGVGPELTYVPGQIYLAGPFGGAPLSVAVVTPAVAGPFDAGTVVIREALDADPSSAQVQIDGARSEPIPRILKGIPLRVRDVRAYVDRDRFTFNATSCEPLRTQATIFGSAAEVFSASATKSAPYQASSCANLGFDPKLALSLVGGTKRSGHPALHSTLTYPYPSGPGYSNIARAVVTLPPTEFIDNAHINNPCTRVQFNANACPKGSVLGTAKASTPILADPLEGPVYFRSNGGERPLPDIVADLKGEFEVILVGRVDSLVTSKSSRIRTTFASTPDVPVKKFTLDLYGGKRGLLVNNSNLCAKPRRADVRFIGHNAKRRDSSPLVKTSCGKKASKKSR